MFCRAFLWACKILFVRQYDLEPQVPSDSVTLQTSSQISAPCSAGTGSFIFDRLVVKSGVTVVRFTLLPWTVLVPGYWIGRPQVRPQLRTRHAPHCYSVRPILRYQRCFGAKHGDRRFQWQVGRIGNISDRDCGPKSLRILPEDGYAGRRAGPPTHGLASLLRGIARLMLVSVLR